MEWLQRVRIPETNVSIGSATTCRQEAILMRRPANGLDSGCVLVEFGLRLI